MSRLTLRARLLLLALALAAPGIGVSLVFLFAQEHSLKLRLTLVVFLFACTGWLTYLLVQTMLRHVRGISNLISSLREADFTLRAVRAPRGDEFGQLLAEVNALADQLQAQRLGAVESRFLLRKMLGELQTAVFGFDADGRLSSMNLSAERLLGRQTDELLGKSAAELGLAVAMESAQGRLLPLSFACGSGRWEVRRTSYMEEGREHVLLLLSDLSPALREEERRAWERLIQVLRHEVNNSLGPIQSLAGTLAKRVESKPEGWEEKVREGLDIIESRSRSLGRFLESYSRLARQPEPQLAPVSVEALVRATCALETRTAIAIGDDEDCFVLGDRGQLEQLLLNLLRNAVEAAELEGGGVEVSWEREADGDGRVNILVDDQGPGIGNEDNLFVPFFTTKPGGTGVGLVVSRQIAEAHGGSLQLLDRDAGPGCRARLWLRAAP